MVIARRTIVFGILMEAARRVKNAKKSSKEYKAWATSKDYKKWKESHDSGKADCCRVMKLDCIGHVQKRMGTHLWDIRRSKQSSVMENQ